MSLENRLNMMEDHLRNSKNIIIMPFHLNSVLLFHSLSCKGIQVISFWDNNISLNGRLYEGTSITLPPHAESLNEEVAVIVYYKDFEQEITKQLFDLGYSNVISAHDLNLDETLDHFGSINLENLIRINPRFKKYKRKLYIYSKIHTPMKKPTEMLKIISDEFCKRGKKPKARKILLLSHELGINGAPIALQNAANAIAEVGDIPILCCRMEGSLLETLRTEGIPVLIDILLMESDFFMQLVSLCDIVIVNTFTNQSLKAIKILNGLSIPVLWWVHEGDMGFAHVQIDKFPPIFEKNIHIYCVGKYSINSLSIFHADISARILLYGIVDFYSGDRISSSERLSIMTIGKIGIRKGQDTLCDAIRKMDDSIRKKCEFVFVGKEVFNKPVYENVVALKNEFPNNVTIIGEVERDKISELLCMCDCMVCASRDDPMPIFITEAMMFHKIVICSENTGFKYLIEDGVNGFIYSPNNADELCSKLEHYVKNSAGFSIMKNNSRKTYENNFSFSIFRNNLIEILDMIERNNSI